MNVNLERTGGFQLSKVQFTAILLCLLWIASPLLMMMMSLFLENHHEIYYFNNRFQLANSWYVLLLLIGLIGCTLLLVSSLWKRIEPSPLQEPWRNRFIRNLSPLMLLGLLIWAVFSTVFSDDLRTSLIGSSYRREGLITYFAYAGIFFCGYLLKEKHLFSKVLQWFIWTSSLLALLMLLDIEVLNRLFTFHENSAIFYNINHFAYYLCMAIMSTAALYMMGRDLDPHRKQYLVCLVVLVAALVKNKSFGPYLAVVAGLLFLFTAVKLYDKSHMKNLMRIIGVFAISSLAANLLYGELGAEIIKLISALFDIVLETENAPKAGSGRWELWIHGLNFITEKPLFGYGPDNLGARYLAEGISHDRPHNELIQIAASLGIPALFFYLVALARHFSILFVHRASLEINNISLNAIIVAYLFSSLLGNTMYYTSPFFFMLLGITIGQGIGWEKALLHAERT